MVLPETTPKEYSVPYTLTHTHTFASNPVMDGLAFGIASRHMAFTQKPGRLTLSPRNQYGLEEPVFRETAHFLGSDSSFSLASDLGFAYPEEPI